MHTDIGVIVREAKEEDFDFVLSLMDTALGPYYGGDHRAHARRIFSTHISGGEDCLGHFSTEQKTTLPAFTALLTDIPYALRTYGRKLYIHIAPSVEETIALQQRGWRLDAAMPAAYHSDYVTQQWSLDIGGEDFMRLMRVKQPLLDLIRAGKKTLEVRVAYDSIKTIRPGERIRLTSRTQTQLVRVKGIRQYAGFEEMLASEEAGRIVPGMTTAQVLQLLRDIYPPQRESLGAVVLEIQTEA